MANIIQPFSPNELKPAAAKEHYKKLSMLPLQVIEENLMLVEDIVSFLCSTTLKQAIKHAIGCYEPDADVRLTYSVIQPEKLSTQESVKAYIDAVAYSRTAAMLPREKIVTACIAATQVGCCMLPQYMLPAMHLDEGKIFCRYIAVSSLLGQLFFDKPDLPICQVMFNAEFPSTQLKHSSLASIDVHTTSCIKVRLAHFDTLEELIAELGFEGYSPCSTGCF